MTTTSEILLGLIIQDVGIGGRNYISEHNHWLENSQFIAFKAIALYAIVLDKTKNNKNL